MEFKVFVEEVKDFDSKKDLVRMGVRVAAFFGTTMAVNAVSKVCAPLGYGIVRRTLYSYGTAFLGMALGEMAAEEAAATYDSVRLAINKKYNVNNETVDSETDKEVMTDDDKSSDNSETDI